MEHKRRTIARLESETAMATRVQADMVLEEDMRRGDLIRSHRKELENENSRLKRLLAEAELDKAMLKEALRGNG